MNDILWKDLKEKKSEIADFLGNKFNYIYFRTSNVEMQSKEENLISLFEIEQHDNSPIYLVINNPADLENVNEMIVQKAIDLANDINDILDTMQLSENANKTLTLVSKVIVKFVRSYRKKMRLEIDANSIVDLQHQFARGLAKELNDRIFQNILTGLYNGLNSSDKQVYVLVIQKLNMFLADLGIYTSEIKEGMKMDYDKYDVVPSDHNGTTSFELEDCIKEVQQLCYLFSEELIIANGQAVVWRLMK